MDAQINAEGWKESAEEAAKFAWENRKIIAAIARAVRRWLPKPKTTSSGKKTNVLVIGPGGVGKSTVGALFAGTRDPLLDAPTEYNESLRVEEFPLADDSSVELVVLPGQDHRRDSTWGSLQTDITSGAIRGIISVGAYGYHTLGLISMEQHKLFKGNAKDFLDAYLCACRADELKVLDRLRPAIAACNRKFWLLSLVTKQDLWWKDRENAEQFYRKGAYAQNIADIAATLGQSRFRSELVFVSLVINNFRTGFGELLAETSAGYDQQLQSASLCRLWETLAALRTWEQKP